METNSTGMTRRQFMRHRVIAHGWRGVHPWRYCSNPIRPTRPVGVPELESIQHWMTSVHAQTPRYRGDLAPGQ